MSLWDIESGHLLSLFQGFDQMQRLRLAFSSDGKWLASAASDRSILVWSVQERKELRRFSGLEQAPRCLALSGDGKLLAAGCSDGSVRLWDVVPAEGVHPGK